MRVLMMVTAAAAAMSLAACAGGMGMADNSSMAASAAGSPAAANVPTSAATYVAEAARSDMYEIQSSQLAQTRASSPQVKSFAKTMITDHTATTQALRGALANASMPAMPPPALDARRADMIKQLGTVSGASFDQMYLQQQLMAHQEALTLHQTYATSGDSGALQGVAKEIVPKIQQHLTMLQGMQPA
jgi:putative membrane protein